MVTVLTWTVGSVPLTCSYKAVAWLNRTSRQMCIHWHSGCGFGTIFACQFLPEVQNYMVKVKPEMVGGVPILPAIQIHDPAKGKDLNG